MANTVMAMALRTALNAGLVAMDLPAWPREHDREQWEASHLLPLHNSEWYFVMGSSVLPAAVCIVMMMNNLLRQRLSKCQGMVKQSKRTTAN